MEYWGGQIRDGVCPKGIHRGGCEGKEGKCSRGVKREVSEGKKGEKDLNW